MPAATAILDRFLHHAEILHITGKSYRMKDRYIAIKNKEIRLRRTGLRERLAIPGDRQVVMDKP